MSSNKRSATQALLDEEPETQPLSPRLLFAGVTPGPGVMRRGMSIAPPSAASMIAGARSPASSVPTAPASPPPSPSIASVPGTPVVAPLPPVQALSPGFASLMKANSTATSPASAGAPKAHKKNVKGKRETEAHVLLVYAMVDGVRMYLGTFYWNLFDRYRWFKCELEIESEKFCYDDLRFMYPNRKRALLEAAGFVWPGPLYLPVNTPVWKFIVTPEENTESMLAQSALIVQMKDQIVRLVDKSPDLSNGANCEFAVIVTEVEIAESEWSMLFCLR